MENAALYELRNYGEATLWLLAIALGTLGLHLKELLLVRLSAATMVVLGVYLVGAYLYFKKSPVLRGVSPKSKISIVATFIMAILLIWAAYYLWTIRLSP